MKNKKVIIGVAIGVVVAIVAAIAVAFVVTGNDDDKSSKKKSKPEKNKVEVQEEQIASGPVVATYGNYELTAGEYNYFYMSLYNQVVNIANQYDQYYPGMGAQYFDVTVDPADQQCQETDHPDGVVTWADYFACCAPERAALVMKLYDDATSTGAQNQGFSLSADDKNEIDDAINNAIEIYESEADDLDITLDEYFEKVFGEYVTEALFRELLEKEYVAEHYLAWYQENIGNSISDDEVDEYYNEHKDEIDVVAIRVFGVSYASGYTADEARERLESFVEELNSGKSFVELAIEYSPEEDKSSYEDDSATLMNYQTKADLEAIYTGLGEWAFAAETKANDTKIIELESNKAFFVVMLEKTAEKNETPTSVAVRHILIEISKTATDHEGNEVNLPTETIELNRVNAMKKANEVLEKLAEKGNTEEAFVELVSTYSDDTGSISDGGLYEDINYQTNFVVEFLYWALAPHSEGDVEIIQTTYGYHVMYYVGGDTTPIWVSEVRGILGTELFEDYYISLTKDVRNNIAVSEDDIDEVRERAEEIVALKVQQNAAYASNGSYYY